MKNLSTSLLFLLLLFIASHVLPVQAQQGNKPFVETITKAKERGITKDRLDSLYRSAVHVDSTKSVFKTEEDKDSMFNAYHGFLQEPGNYLKANDFKWEQPSKCWNRIYFAADGTVEYYLFEFKTDIGSQKVERFKELFTSFSADHKIKMTAHEPFAQCSGVVYMDK